MLRHKPLHVNWHFLLVGLLFIIMQCDARAVNVSNTWTMPQEGLNVFYRFFRDRISWFEADAVCQFHHANLVTVDNSFQFDATRDLLRELDVNDIVWIGLMRPQSSDRFMWSSNSRPLVADTGYWAESLPLMDAPLCAVIDPIRDYRWHALRCGGPETASFLCEMPVPSWADACNLKDMPNLTLQYMADTASIELIRNCQEEGLLRTMCRGKQDRERAAQDLICPRERLEAQRINDITNSHFKSLKIINSIPTDNNENNDIELLPIEVNYGPHYPEELQTEKNTVQRLIEQFNVDELMQADEPSNMETISSFYKIPGLIPKPVKKSAKKVLQYPKKESVKQVSGGASVDYLQKEKKRLPVEMEEMMMGDQPLQGEPELPEQFLNEEVSNEILEPLPHIKKTNIHKEDGLEKMEKEATAMKKSMHVSKDMEVKKMFMITTAPATTTTTTDITIVTEPATTITTMSSSSISTTAPSTAVPTTTMTTRFSEDHTHKHSHELHTQVDNTWNHIGTTTSPATIGHPMHPQQPHGNIITEESQHIHTKESADSSHFIPPMLMVKSHYIPPTGKHGHSEHDHHHQQQQLQAQQHENEQPHLETTTEEQTETTTKLEEKPTSDTMMIMMKTATTPKVLDIQTPTLKTLDTSMNSKDESEMQAVVQRQEEHQEHQVTSTATEGDGSMKSITEQYQTETETEQRKNSKNLHFPDKQTAITAKIVQSAASTTAQTTATNSEEINKNNAGNEKDPDENQELKPPQTTRIDAETTQATKPVATTEKSLKFTQKLYDLETATGNAEEGTATEEVIRTEPQQQQMQTMEQKLTAIKTEENEEHLQITTGTTEEKLVVTKTAEVITTPTAALAPAPATQQYPITIKAETQSLQQIQKEQTNKEQLEEQDQDKKETVVKTTEILATSTAIIKAQAEEEEEEEEEAGPAITTYATTTSTSTSKTTTTTVKPITTTFPQYEAKSTETSSSTTTTTIISSTTTDEDNSVTTTTTPPTTTTFTSLPASSLAAITTNTTEIEAESATVTTRTEAFTQSPSPPETTRNFLKVTTEMPFKPNRRRSLTKPETVSYMKKILG